jgi:hypothetical protein
MGGGDSYLMDVLEGKWEVGMIFYRLFLGFLYVWFFGA